MNYRKKPVVVQAHQWFKNGDHPDDNVMRPFEDTGEMPEYPREGSVVRYYCRPDVPGNRTCAHCREIMHIHGWIDTKEGGHIVCPADWIITGVKGEHYPCKPDIFVLTYEPATPAPAVTGNAPSALPGTEQPGVAARPEAQAWIPPDDCAAWPVEKQTMVWAEVDFGGGEKERIPFWIAPGTLLAGHPNMLRKAGAVQPRPSMNIGRT